MSYEEYDDEYEDYSIDEVDSASNSEVPEIAFIQRSDDWPETTKEVYDEFFKDNDVYEPEVHKPSEFDAKKCTNFIFVYEAYFIAGNTKLYSIRNVDVTAVKKKSSAGIFKKIALFLGLGTGVFIIYKVKTKN